MIANHQALQGACLEIRSVMDRSLRQLRSQGYKTGDSHQPPLSFHH